MEKELPSGSRRPPSVDAMLPRAKFSAASVILPSNGRIQPKLIAASPKMENVEYMQNGYLNGGYMNTLVTAGPGSTQFGDLKSSSSLNSSLPQ